MSWRQENGPDGLPVWRGKDAIFNQMHEGGKKLQIAAAAWVALVAFFLWMDGFKFTRDVAIVAALVLPLAALFLAFSLLWGRQFVGSEWSLEVHSDFIGFKGREKWAVPLDAVARVETGKTADYVPARYYGFRAGSLPQTPLNARLWGWKMLDTSEHEWQVFLFMADGTRRVIYHANAARDDCAALAASIRGYVESAKASVPASAAPAVDAPRAAGFDL